MWCWAGLDTFGARVALPECSIHPELRDRRMLFCGARGWADGARRAGAAGVRVARVMKKVNEAEDREAIWRR
jgi:hypothetical protein